MSSNKQQDSRDLKPDISMRILPLGMVSRRYRHGETFIEEPFDCTCSALSIEVKHNNTDDPFVDFDGTTSSCENTRDSGKTTRGQIAMYADLQFRHQHRKCAHQLTICGCWCRFSFWDRSGVLVSQSFNYVNEPQLLMEFLWKFAHLDDRDQGWDESVAWANVKERHLFESALHAQGASGGLPDELILLSLDQRFPVCKVLVSDDHAYLADNTGRLCGNGRYQPREFIIGAPFYTTCSTPGRGTRAFLAYDLQDGTIKFMKDTWTPSLNCSPEMDAYCLLLEKEVPSIMYPICGGFVRCSDGVPQCTINHKWATAVERWLAPRNPKMRAYRHVRIVQDVMHRLKDLKNSRELIEVLLNVVECKC